MAHIQKYIVSGYATDYLKSFLELSKSNKRHQKNNFRLHQLFQDKLLTDFSPWSTDKLHMHSVPQILEKSSNFSMHSYNVVISDVPISNDDTIQAIKESLESEKDVAIDLLYGLNIEVFKCLYGILDAEEACKLGRNILSGPMLSNKTLLQHFYSYIVLPKLSQDFHKVLYTLIELVIESDYDNFAFACATFIKKNPCHILVNYVKLTDRKFKHKLMRHLTSDLDESVISESHFEIWNVLIGAETELNDFLVLARCLLAICDQHIKNKSFGKLLMTLITHSKSYFTEVEGIIQRILASHQSMWRKKLQKAFDSCYQDSSMYTQSLTYRT